MMIAIKSLTVVFLLAFVDLIQSKFDFKGNKCTVQ